MNEEMGAGVFQTGSGQRRVSLITTNAGMSFHKRAYFSALSGRIRKGDVLVPLHPHRQVQMISKRSDPKTAMRYDHGRENLDQNAVNFLGYDEV